MRHLKAGRKLGRTTSHREAMLRNLVCSLFEHGRVITTVPKAKEARRLAEKCITTALRAVVAQDEVEEQLKPLREQADTIRGKLQAALLAQAKGRSDQVLSAVAKAIKANAGTLSETQIAYIQAAMTALENALGKPEPSRREMAAMEQRVIQAYEKMAAVATGTSALDLPKVEDDATILGLRRELRLVAGKIASLSAKGQHQRRLLFKRLHQKSAVWRLLKDIAPAYRDTVHDPVSPNAGGDKRPGGGYTRILKAGFRKGDNAPKALFELVIQPAVTGGDD